MNTSSGNGSRCASPTEFGFDFQHNAGIVLMLKFIKDVEKVRCEGNREDVELTLMPSGKKVYAQAKSKINPDDSHDAMAKLGQALISLNEAYWDGDAEALIYVTNLENPFNDVKSIRTFSVGVPMVAYEELPTSAKEKLDKAYQRKKLTFDRQRLKVLTFSFRDGENKYNAVKQLIEEFLVGIDNSRFIGMGKQVMRQWQLLMQQNASTLDSKVVIGKRQLFWSLIVMLCNNSSDELLDDCDPAELQDVRYLYSQVISESAERFELVTKVLSEFAEYRECHPDEGSKECFENFIRNRWKVFASEFSIPNEFERTKELVIKLSLNKILTNRKFIVEVKKSANLV